LARNKSRTGAKKATAAASPAGLMGSPGGQLIFETPTDFVELPSQGRFYASDHPLHNKETVEIKHMTAKEEDILASRTLLKKGLALDRLIQSVICDKSIDPATLLVGDKNAILIAARETGYGEEYDTQVMCPACNNLSQITCNLEDRSINYGGVHNGEEIEFSENGTFSCHLPSLNMTVELRLLTGKEESYLAKLLKNKKEKNLPESSLSDLMRMIIVSVEGHTDGPTLSKLVEMMPARDARILRETYSSVIPTVSLQHNFSCPTCNHEGILEAPLNAEFFWPKR
jgi:transcription elongation factor Elf1